jgi:competence protein ComEA
MVLGLFALGAAHDLWRLHGPPPPWSEASLPVAVPSAASSSAMPPGAALTDDSTHREMHDARATVAKRVDLNRADAGELDQLPGIGPVLAGRIVEHRRISGPYRSAEDLLAVRGIGPALFERLRDRVTVGTGQLPP